MVSTHILSSEIEVQGAFKSNNEDKLYKFNIVLDRSLYENKDKLINSIEATKKKFRAINSSFDKSEYTGFMTSFSYKLGKRLPNLSTTLDVVGIGLKYIYEILPYTLCFMSKVQSVRIIDNRRKSTIQNYLIKRISNISNPLRFEITENSKTVNVEFIKLKYQQVETVYRHSNGVVISLPKDITKLFCGLPMIGSENIGLPFILNSFDFEPTLEREGVEITPNDKQNITLFKQSVELYSKLLRDIEAKKLDDAYHFTKLTNKFRGVEASKNIFRRDFVPEYRAKIEKSKIVRNINGEFIWFSDILLPYKEGNYFKELYKYASELKHAKLPDYKSCEGWVNSTDFTLFPKQKYDLRQFIEELSQISNVQAFVLKSEMNVIDWLKGIASLVNDVDKNLFSKYAILPNQKGDLRKKTDLFIDFDIPTELKSIHNKLNDEEIENILLNKSFNDFNNVIDTSFDTSYICNKIDNILKEKYSENKASTASFVLPLNDLFKWMKTSAKEKKELEDLFPWFYSRRATLFLDTFGENERDYAFTIVQSGKIKVLAALAKSNISDEALEYIAKNPEMISKFYALIQDEINDRGNANSETGNFGEQLVYTDLRKKYKPSNGYEIIWASKQGEQKYDFEVRFKGKTALYIDAKTTIRGISNSDSIPFFMRKSQWDFLPTISSSTDVKYLIARVFKKEKIIKYLEINMFKEE